MPTLDDIGSYQIRPNPTDPKLSRVIEGVDQYGQPSETCVIEERPLTIYLNSQEIVTAMTIGDYPEYLAVGFLKNQGMLKSDDVIEVVEYDEELDVVVVRTERESNYEEKLSKKTRTSGCAVGTVFGDMMEGVDQVKLAVTPVHTSWIYRLSHLINRTPSLYLETGAIHGTVLCEQDEPLVYMEDVGRHNAVDKISGWMHLEGVSPDNKIMYTTGRLTSEMVIKTALMGIPVLVSRSGFTAWGVDIAKQVGLTLVGRMRGRKFICLSGEERLIYDTDPDLVPEEDKNIAARALMMSDRILGVVLAGGLATRMGGSDKGLLQLGQQTILDEVLKRFRPQVDEVVLNVNGDTERFASFGLPCIADSLDGHLGPLAGVLAALEHAREHQFGWVASVAADTPFFPTDFVSKARYEVMESQAPVVLASSFDHEKSRWMRHPTFGIWHVSLEDNLRDALQGGIRKIVIWTDSVGGSEIQCAHEPGSLDPFFNVNTPEDLVIAQQGAR